MASCSQHVWHTRSTNRNLELRFLGEFLQDGWENRANASSATSGHLRTPQSTSESAHETSSQLCGCLVGLLRSTWVRTRLWDAKQSGIRRWIWNSKLHGYFLNGAICSRAATSIVGRTGDLCESQYSKRLNSLLTTVWRLVKLSNSNWSRWSSMELLGEVVRWSFSMKLLDGVTRWSCLIE